MTTTPIARRRIPNIVIHPLLEHVANLVDTVVRQGPLDLQQQRGRSVLDARAEGRDGVQEGAERDQVGEVVRDSEGRVGRGGRCELGEKGEALDRGVGTGTCWTTSGWSRVGGGGGAARRQQARDDLVEIERLQPAMWAKRERMCQ